MKFEVHWPEPSVFVITPGWIGAVAAGAQEALDAARAQYEALADELGAKGESLAQSQADRGGRGRRPGRRERGPDGEREQGEDESGSRLQEKRHGTM